MLAVYAPAPRPTRTQEAPFTMLLGSGLALFFCLSVGLAARWLYDLMPADLAFQPFAPDRVTPQFQMLGAAGVIYLSLRGLARSPYDVRLLDIDAFYRGPVADAGRWAGILALRLYGAWQGWLERLGRAVATRLGALARAWDQPYVRTDHGAIQFLCVATLLLIMLLAR
jgi:hypothetical protein